MATKGMTIKLMIDTESNRLIYAEASKDFVDFLIFLLSLPIGAITNLLTSESMVGSIGNIHKSVANLNQTYLLRNVYKDDFLYPVILSDENNIPLTLRAETGPSSIDYSGELYTCRDSKCKSGITNLFRGVRCPGCRGMMNQEIDIIHKYSEGYVEKVASYMVSDDLSITSISSMSVISMMNKFNAYKLEERKVKIGTKRTLELLKASLQSTTVLSDVFLKGNKEQEQGKEPESSKKRKRELSDEDEDEDEDEDDDDDDDDDDDEDDDDDDDDDEDDDEDNGDDDDDDDGEDDDGEDDDGEE